MKNTRKNIIGKYLLISLIIVIRFYGSSSAQCGLKGDINDDGKIDLKEAVYALQVAAGILGSETPVCESINGKCYYISNKSGSGSGTFTDPFGLADLPKSDINSCGLSSPAFEILQPGDILYFREGIYEFSTCHGAYYYLGYLRTRQHGLPNAPITFKAYPKESVELRKKDGSQPILGNYGSDHIIYKGFTVISNDETACARVYGTGAEIAYCELIGHYLETTDNHDGIRIEDAENTWIHHNVIHGVTGLSANSAGVKLYNSKNVIIEDNYIYNNFTGIFDKMSGINNTYRRNYLKENTEHAFYGNNQGNISTVFIYDNVISGRLELHYLTEDAEIHDNLIFDYRLTAAWAGSTWNTKIWNNIVISNSDKIIAYREPQNHFVNTGDKKHLAYMDYNIYDAAPKYAFGEYATPPIEPIDISEMRNMNFENNSAIVNDIANVFIDEISYKILPKWEDSGRYGDGFGPESVKDIINISRYGPYARQPER